MDDTRGHAERETERLWRLAAMGGTMASEIIAGALIGLLLDRLFGTAPTLLIVLTCLGVTVGMTTFIRNAVRESRKAAGQARRIAGHLRTRTPPDDGHADDRPDGEPGRPDSE